MRGLAADLGRVPRRLGVDGVDLEAPLQRVYDEVAQAVGDGRGIRVDDDEHAPLGRLRVRTGVQERRLRGFGALADGGHLQAPYTAPTRALLGPSFARRDRC